MDTQARQTALAMLTQLKLGTLGVQEFESQWPHRSPDLGVRSIGYFIWTLYSDDDPGCIQVGNDIETGQIIDNAMAFLSSRDEFMPRPAAAVSRFRQFLSRGNQWRGCELPWHLHWPKPPRA